MYEDFLLQKQIVEGLVELIREVVREEIDNRLPNANTKSWHHFR